MNPSTTHDIHLNVSPLARLQAYVSHSSGARIIKALALLVALALGITSTAEAKRPRSNPPPDPQSSMQKITEVNALSIKVAVGTAGTSVQSYSITDSTKVTLNGAPANARDLKAGMIAKVEPSADGRTAVTITAQDPPAHPGRNRTG
jgi:hypothetical protein